MSRFVVGIDLGTTNSALAYADTAETTPEAPATIRALSIPQVVAVNEVGERPVLPSFLYLAAPKEFPTGAVDLPWKAPADRVVGRIGVSHRGDTTGSCRPVRGYCVRIAATPRSWRRSRTRCVPTRRSRDQPRDKPMPRPRMRPL